jgi:predicted permease
MNEIRHDAAYALRKLRRTPGFTASVLLAVALGVGVAGPVVGMVRAGLQGGPYRGALLGGAPVPPLAPWSAELRTIAQAQDAALRPLLWTLLALALALAAIGLVNVLTLLLARGSARRPELAMRAVLGAGRGRLVAQLATEGGLLAGAGAGVGLLLAGVVASALAGTWPDGAAPWEGLDGSAAAVAAALFCAVAVAAWLTPVGVAWRRDLRRHLATGARATAGKGEARLRNGLAVVQLAVSLVILTCAGLLLRSFAAAPAEGARPGFDPRDTLTLRVELPAGAPESHAAAYGRVLQRVRAVPGVTAASLASEGAWVGLGPTDRALALCRECSAANMLKVASEGPARVHAVSPGYFAALGVPVRGREADGAAAEAVVNTAFAYRLFPRGEPLGKRVQVGRRGDHWVRVVGVVEDPLVPGIGAGAEAVPAVYLSAARRAPSAAGLAVRVAGGDPGRLLPAVRAAVLGTVPGAAVSRAMTMEAYLHRFGAPLRWMAALVAGLAAAALLLAASGLSAVMSFNVARRTREIGIRMALGARDRDVARMVLGQGLRVTRAGIVLGLFGAVPLARMLQLLLKGADPFDGGLFLGLAGALAAVAVAASLRPALRAARVDPQVSLRQE